MDNQGNSDAVDECLECEHEISDEDISFCGVCGDAPLCYECAEYCCDDDEESWVGECSEDY